MRTVYDVHEGYPSWHQQRAGHISAAVTSGFRSRAEAEKLVDALKKHHPGMHVFILERRIENEER